MLQKSMGRTHKSQQTVSTSPRHSQQQHFFRHSTRHVIHYALTHEQGARLLEQVQIPISVVWIYVRFGGDDEAGLRRQEHLLLLCSKEGEVLDVLAGGDLESEDDALFSVGEGRGELRAARGGGEGAPLDGPPLLVLPQHRRLVGVAAVHVHLQGRQLLERSHQVVQVAAPHAEHRAARLEVARPQPLVERVIELPLLGARVEVVRVGGQREELVVVQLRRQVLPLELLDLEGHVSAELLDVGDMLAAQQQALHARLVRPPQLQRGDRRDGHVQLGQHPRHPHALHARVLRLVAAASRRARAVRRLAAIRLAAAVAAAGAAGAALGRVLGRVLVRVLQQLRVAPLDERRHLLHLCDGRRLGRHDQQLRARERRVVRRDALQPRLRLPLALDPRLPPDARLVRRRHRVQQLDPPLLLAQRGGRLRVPRIVAVEREPTVLAVRLLEGGPPVDVPVGKPVAAEARARVARDGGPGELYQRRRRQLRRVDRHARARVLPHPVGAVPRLPLRL
mmetsp:Transcript_25030/g.73759  ORF Transcript_25030/g.73759 Transcript_25030/m.73759 type:complete len:508 (-) Transcript_25030:46-1569(-)